MGVGDLIQANTANFMKSQNLCPKLGSDWRQKRREKEVVLDSSEWCRSCGMHTCGERGDTQFVSFLALQGPVMRMQGRNTVAHGTGKVEYSGPCAAAPTMDCTGNWVIGKDRQLESTVDMEEEGDRPVAEKD